MLRDPKSVAEQPLRLAETIARVQAAVEECVSKAEVRKLPGLVEVRTLISPAASAMAEALTLIRKHVLPKCPDPVPGQARNDLMLAFAKLESAVQGLDDALRTAADRVMELPPAAGEVYGGVRADMLTACREAADAFEEGRERFTGLAFVPLSWLAATPEVTKSIRQRRAREIKQRKAQRRQYVRDARAGREVARPAAASIKRTGTRLIAEKFLPGEQVLECEKCGAGMSERVRRGGKHMLVCGYCSAERELAAPAKGQVASHDLFSALREKRELLQPVQGLNAWSCTECGAEVECAAAAMTDRCGYCGSHSFTPLQGGGGVLQPQGVLRFACTPERATQMLRTWLQSRPDAPAELAAEIEVETVQQRYVPYWILNVTVPDPQSPVPLASINNFHCCASRQLLHRMPAELRGIEPFETRSVPPFESSQLAGLVTERFTIDLAHAWKRAGVAARAAADAAIRRRLVESSSGALLDPKSLQGVSEEEVRRRVEAGMGRSEPTFRYLLLPVFFFVLKWQGRELHALVDGAGAGVGMDYPRSAARIAQMRLVRMAAAVAVCVVILGVGVFVYFGQTSTEIDQRRIKSEWDATIAQGTIDINESTRRAKQKEAEEREAENRRRNPPPDPRVWREVASTPLSARTWESPPLRLVCGFESLSGITPIGETVLDAKAVVYLRDGDSRCPLYMQKLNDPHTLVAGELSSALRGMGKLSLSGEPGFDNSALEVARKAVLAAARIDEGDTFSGIDRVEIVRTGDPVVPAFDGTVSIVFDVDTLAWFTGGSLRVTMPVEDVPAFCRIAVYMRLAEFACNALLANGDLRWRPEDNEVGLKAAQEAVDGFLKQKSAYDGWNVTVTELYLGTD